MLGKKKKRADYMHRTIFCLLAGYFVPFFFQKAIWLKLHSDVKILLIDWLIS